MNHRYRGLFEDWEIGVATNVVNRFRNQWTCLEREGFDDLLQECLTHWHFSKDDYNPSAGANVRTFMSRVVEHKVQKIIRKLTRDCRNVTNKSVSLDSPISDEEDSPTFLDKFSADESHASELHLKAELKIDVFQTIKKLTPKQQELCRLLNDEGLNINQASKAMQIPRGTLYEDIKRIRTIFQQEGLHEYLD